ncbi:MAG: hypothetical protein E6K70_17775 [Planctomycetota bacterium]|nr:MAG: hypothetical protein E6K70_17775 [Planctomycetota bacterium]
MARFGDQDAARKLVEPGDADTLRQIEALALDRSYPLEWTRLAALLMHHAQIRLATGDIDGGTEVVVLHKQLKGVLGGKAAKSDLGAALLPRGREALARAAASWQEDKKTELADQANTILAAWGDTPAPPLALRYGISREQVQQALGITGKERSIATEQAARALDVFALPFPDEGAEAIVACLDDANRLADVFVTYKAGLADSYQEPTQLAHLLEESKVEVLSSPKAPGLYSRVYRLGDWQCDATIISHGAGAGALVHFGKGELPAAAPLARDLGALKLDRSFERNRLVAAPEQRKDTVTTGNSKLLAGMHNPLPALKPTQAAFGRVADHNLTSWIALEYNPEEALPALHKILLPLWGRTGTPRFEGKMDEHGGHLECAWQDAQTRYAVWLPYEATQPVRFEASDIQPADRIGKREGSVGESDREERKARLQAGKPILRVPRQLEQVELGMTRAQILELLPGGRSVVKSDIPDGLSVTFAGEASREDKYITRQLLVRFDRNGRATEIRARYVAGPGAGQGNAWTNLLLNTVRKTAGAPLEMASSWSSVWADAPGRKVVAQAYRWQDDATLAMFQRDAGGAELCLRDCPPDYEDGVPLPAFECLPRGAGAVVLGMKSQQLVQELNNVKPDTTADGAWIIRPDASSPYDVLLVWFDKDQVTRIVARHTPVTRNSGSTSWGQIITEAWTRDVRSFGWPRQQQLVGNDMLQALGFHDERTRVRIFWQENDDGSVKVFTEWKELPR